VAKQDFEATFSGARVHDLSTGTIFFGIFFKVYWRGSAETRHLGDCADSSVLSYYRELSSRVHFKCCIYISLLKSLGPLCSLFCFWKQNSGNCLSHAEANLTAGIWLTLKHPAWYQGSTTCWWWERNWPNHNLLVPIWETDLLWNGVQWWFWQLKFITSEGVWFTVMFSIRIYAKLSGS
jgi:hypothetical protein